MAKTSGGNRGGTKGSGVQSMTFEQFAASRGASAWEGARPDLDRQPRSTDKERKRNAEKVLADMRANAKLRETLKTEYNALVQQGKIKTPTRFEELIKKARGHEDNAATHAARRVLEKRGIKW